jgi:hypothetical protein
VICGLWRLQPGSSIKYPASPSAGWRMFIRAGSIQHPVSSI